MSRSWLGVAGPCFAAAVVMVVLRLSAFPHDVAAGAAGGCLIALAQSLISVAAMKMAWNTKWFYWAWGGGMLFRMAVFAVTALVVYRGVGWSFLATMTSLVVATTVFLVFESMSIFGKKGNGFSRASRTSSS